MVSHSLPHKKMLCVLVALVTIGCCHYYHDYLTHCCEWIKQDDQYDMPSTVP